MALHFTKDERERMFQMTLAGLSHAQFGRALGPHRGTIGRELARNSVEGRYAVHVAQDLADERRRTRVRKVERTETNAAVRWGLARRWSPDQIAGRLRRDFPNQPQFRRAGSHRPRQSSDRASGLNPRVPLVAGGSACKASWGRGAATRTAGPSYSLSQREIHGSPLLPVPRHIPP